MLGSAEDNSGPMALELGPQASGPTAETRIPDLSCIKQPRQGPPLRFRPSAGSATPQQEPRRLVANAPNAQAQPGGRRVAGDSANPRSRAGPDVGRAQPCMSTLPRGGSLGLSCGEVALGPRQLRDRTFTTAAPKAGCRTGAHIPGAALGVGGRGLWTLPVPTEPWLPELTRY